MLETACDLLLLFEPWRLTPALQRLRSFASLNLAPNSCRSTLWPSGAGAPKER